MPINLHFCLDLTQSNTTKIFLLSHDESTQHMVNYTDYLIQSKEEFNIKFIRTSKVLLQDYSLQDFVLLKEIGKGKFGKVLIVQHKKNSKNEYHALKLIEKMHMVRCNRVEHVHNELVLLSAVNYPFVTKLLFCFISNVYVCLGMPFHDGGDLFQNLRNAKMYEEDRAQFYAGQIILAFEYLHFLGIVYRDLKPENILFERNGYLKIVDFGFAKKIDDNRTYTLCGTPDYLAPELLSNKGHGKGVDWWTLGILVYEMTAGRPPFYSQSPTKMYIKIIKGVFECPIHFSKSLIHLLQNVIMVDTTKRFGLLRNGVNDLKEHEWFQSINWDHLFNQSIKPKYIPKVIDPIDFQSSNAESLLLRYSSSFECFDEFKESF